MSRESMRRGMGGDPSWRSRGGRAGVIQASMECGQEVPGELAGCKGRGGVCGAAEILRPVAQIYLFCSDL